MKIVISYIQRLFRESKYRLTLHAEEERDAEQITKREIEEALLSDKLEIIEDYLNDPKGHSCLLLGFTKKDKPIHFVCGLGMSEILIIITLYIPDTKLWINWRKRRI